MRIISGSARGTKLFTLEGIDTRPTLDRIKESLFNIIKLEIPDTNVLDIFAGSGALGLECASRKSNKVFLCDKSKKAIEVINKNITKTNLNEKVTVMNLDYKECIEKLLNIKFDIIFIDPPYDTNLIKESLERILEKDIIKKDGLIIVETDNEERILKDIANLKIKIDDIRRYGRVKLIFLRKE